MTARLGLVWLAAGLIALALQGGCAGAGANSGSATIVIHFSRFEPEIITMKAGESLTIVLRNEDPIEHEWIVGSEDVHERHRTGTEPYHDAVPTEVTVPALSSRRTTVSFDQAGDYPFICHLPGHEAYGMKGTIRVVGR